MKRTGQVRQWQPKIVTREGNLASTAGETWAYYMLRPTYVNDMQDHQVDALISDGVDRLGDLGGRRVWLRATTVPFPCEELLDRLRSPIGTLPRSDQPGGVTRDALIEDAAYFPVDAAVEVVDGVVTRRLRSRWPVAVIGVRVADRALEQCDMVRVLADHPAPASRGEVEKIRVAYRDVTASVARAGWHAEPVDSDAFAWLYDSSLALGHEVPQQEPGGPPPLADAVVRAVQDDDGVTVPVRVDIDGDVAVRHNRMLRLDTWKERETGVVPAWVAWALRRPYRVEVAALFDVLTPGETVQAVRRRVRHNTAIAEHLRTFKRPVGEQLKHALTRGPELLDAVESGDVADGSQLRGQVVFAVSGDDVREAVETAKRLKAEAAPGKGDTDGRGPGLVLSAAHAQFPEWRKFIPGEDWALHGHTQRQSLAMLASGVPHATDRAGDSAGMPVGAIAGSTDCYFLDWFGGIRRDMSGVTAVAGDMGSGKSSVLALGAWWIKQVDQAPVTIIDPSNRIAEQLRVPETQRETRLIRLDIEGAPGTLASHFLTPDPRRDIYDTDVEWEAACEAAVTQRVEFAIDAAKAALPVASMAGDADVMECLRGAITGAGGEFGTQPGEIIAAIEADGPTGERLAKMIRAYSRLSGGKLLWADRRAGDTYAGGGEEPVTIMSVAGVKTPRSADPTTWDTGEARSVMLLAGVAQLASAHVWASRSAKALMIDEATNLLAGVSAFQGLVQRVALDSRKVTCAAGIAMHLADTLQSVGAHANSLFGAAVLMRTETANARAALPMLRAEPGHGWEDVAPLLGSGEAIVSGWDGRLVRTRFDQSWLPDAFRKQLSTSTLAEAAPLRTLFGAQS